VTACMVRVLFCQHVSKIGIQSMSFYNGISHPGRGDTPGGGGGVPYLAINARLEMV